MSLENVGLKCRNFKCFAGELQGFDEIKPINIIIGRNNSGKTTLLDLIEYAISPQDFDHRGHKKNTPQIGVLRQLTRELLTDSLSTHQASVRQRSPHLVPQQWGLNNLTNNIGFFQIVHSNPKRFADLEIIERSHELQNVMERQNQEWDHVKSQLCSAIKNPFLSYTFRRILAERNIRHEAKDPKIKIAPNGDGVTNAIQRFVLSTGYDRDLIEKTLLAQLNFILRPDADYDRILIEEIENTDLWEIILDEENKGRIPMSETGSGFKTVLQTLANLLILPKLPDNPTSLEKYCFAFEELENNLHPAVQRRLFHYLRQTAIRQNCYFFITTHSNVVIDMFSRDEHAQILHVKHDGKSSTVTKVDSLLHGHNVLTDLDVRASDLLQTNAVVWVEGPSDMIYFNKWIEIWSNKRIIEGIHYQCLTFGGSLNKYLSFDDEDFLHDMVAAFRINKHAIMLADRDGTSAAKDLKVHTKRLKDELEKAGGYAWITAGKEVENYIPADVYSLLLPGIKVKAPGQFQHVIAFLKKATSKETWNKPKLAEAVSVHLTREMLENCLDMKTHLDSICKKINEWNRIE